MANKNIYKVCWKANIGFKCTSYWKKRDMARKVKQLKKQNKFFRAWRVGDFQHLFKS